MFLRDVTFFIGRVAGERDDLHAVIQGLADLSEVIGGADKKDIGKVGFHVDVVIDEMQVLLSVQDLQKSRLRIALEAVSADLVDLIQQHQRVVDARVSEARSDAPREGAHIRSAVTADFRFIMYTAECHPDIGNPES